jgi:hypothetical protein
MCFTVGGVQGRSPAARLVWVSRGTQIPEYVLQGCLVAFKSRNRPSLFVLKSDLPHFRCRLEEENLTHSIP